MKVVGSLFLLLLFQSQKTITSVTLNYDRDSKGVWIAHIANMSHKDVTTVEIGVSLEPDGPVVQDTGEGTDFPPGTTKDITLGFADKDKIYPAVQVVIYADRAAEVTNENAFNHIIKGYKEGILTLQKANEIIKKNASAPNPAAATAEALEALAKTVPDIRHDDNLYPRAMPLRMMAEEIRRGTSPNDLLSRNDEEITKLTQDMQITKVTPGGTQ